MRDLEDSIRQQLTELDSRIDLVALEQPRSEALRLFIDHPEGVDLALCERVTWHLNALRADYALEVSSPGPKYRKEAGGRNGGASTSDSSRQSEVEHRGAR